MNSMDKRLKWFFRISVFIGAAVLLRVLYIQTFNEEYKVFAEEQRKAVEEIKPNRGSIYDSNGVVLAETVKVNSLYLSPYKVQDQERLKEFLTNSLKINPAKIENYLSSEDRSLIKNNLTTSEIEKINAANILGLEIETYNRRHYPEGQYASHLLGFLDSEGHGEYGLEASLDEVLYGKEGMNIQDKSPTGEDIPYEEPETTDAEDGSDIKLTIDDNIQSLVVEEAMKTYEEYKPKHLSIIVMDPNNGRILAMENFPNFDPNNPRESAVEEYKGQGLSEEELTNISFENWRNYSVSDTYEPGSIFKVITAAAAYEEGLIDDNTILECDGSFDEIPGVTLVCHIHPNGHGDQNIYEAMANSCNPAFIQVGRLLGEEKMYEYLNKFGFTSKTGIKLPAESNAIVPSSLDEITEVRLATMSYGHGIAVTPIQMVTAISVVVNGGKLYEPLIIEEYRNPETGKIFEVEKRLVKEVLSESTSDKMKDLLVYGVENGTADGGQIPGYYVGGKTGTTEKIVDGEYSADKTVASFVGLYPAYEPEYVVLAVADEPEGATSGNVVTAPLVADIIEGIIDLRNDQPTRQIIEESEE